MVQNDVEKKLEVTEINEMEKTKKNWGNRHSVCLCIGMCVCVHLVLMKKKNKLKKSM